MKTLPLFSLVFCLVTYAIFGFSANINDSYSHALGNPSSYKTDGVFNWVHIERKSESFLGYPFRLNILETSLRKLNLLDTDGVFIGQLSKTNDDPHLIGKTIVIDPGHGGYETGAIQNSIEEQHATLDVSMKLKKHLESEGARVIMTRDNELSLYQALPLAERVATSFRSSADVFISIHFNSHPDKSIQGTESYFNKHPFNDEKNPFPLESQQLANSIQNNLVDSIRSKNLGIKESDFHVLRNNTVPSTLVEIAFLSNHNEARQIKDENYIEKSAYGISQGIIHYFAE